MRVLHRWGLHSPLLRPLSTLFAVYALLNIVPILVVTFALEASFRLSVVDAASGKAIPQANVGWHGETLYFRDEGVDAIGTTDKAGRLRFERNFGGQPLWLFPLLGEFQLDSTLHIAAPGYETQLVELSEALPSVRYRDPEVVFQVALTPKR